MTTISVVPRQNAQLKSLLNEKVRSLRWRGTTFSRVKEGQLKHNKYPGSINFRQAKSVLIAEVESDIPGEESQLLHAFIGYLDRHLARHDFIESIFVQYASAPLMKKATRVRAGARLRLSSPSRRLPK